MQAIVSWQLLAARLAARAVPHPRSRWFPAVAATPRHVLVPAWFYRDEGTGRWQAWDGSGSDRQEWLESTYANKTRITRIGALHADHAGPGDHPAGMPASSATGPGLTVQMLRLGWLREGDAVCDMGTGTGYSAALLCHRLGAGNITSIDVDPYLTKAAGQRLDSIGYAPVIRTCDATGPLPGEFDAIIASFSVRPCPASWLAALRPGGRVVFVIAGTQLLVYAAKRPDGGAAGRVDAYSAGSCEPVIALTMSPFRQPLRSRRTRSTARAATRSWTWRSPGTCIPRSAWPLPGCGPASPALAGTGSCCCGTAAVPGRPGRAALARQRPCARAAPGGCGTSWKPSWTSGCPPGHSPGTGPPWTSTPTAPSTSPLPPDGSSPWATTPHRDPAGPETGRQPAPPPE